MNGPEHTPPVPPGERAEQAAQPRPRFSTYGPAARIVGLLLLAAFGTTSVAFALYQSRTRTIARQLQRRGTPSFASLKKGETRDGVRGERYFHTYTGYAGQRPYRKQEQVTSELYYTLAEGNNVRILIYRDPSGAVFTRLVGNNLPHRPTFGILLYLSLFLTGVGFLLYVSSLLIREPR